MMSHSLSAQCHRATLNVRDGEQPIGLPAYT